MSAPAHSACDPREPWPRQAGAGCPGRRRCPWRSEPSCRGVICAACGSRGGPQALDKAKQMQAHAQPQRAGPLHCPMPGVGCPSARPRRMEGLTAIKGGGIPRVGMGRPFNNPSAVNIGAFHKAVSLRLGGRATCPMSLRHTEPGCNVHPAPQTCSCLHCLPPPPLPSPQPLLRVILC